MAFIEPSGSPWKLLSELLFRYKLGKGNGA